MPKLYDLNTLISQDTNGTGRITNAEGGNFEVELQDPSTGKLIKKSFNLDTYKDIVAEQAGVNPSDISIQVNTKDTAFDSNSLSFTEKMQMTWAHSNKQQKAFLERKYGKDNVIEEDGDFTIRDKMGAWKKADTGFLESMLADSPYTIASIAGAAKGAAEGAAIGSVVPGIGTAAGGIIGGILGGALAGSVARLGMTKFAEANGIRTVEDVDTLRKEIGAEAAQSMAFDILTLGTGKVLGTGKKMFNSIVNRDAMANTLHKLNNGTDINSWRTLFSGADVAERIYNRVKDNITWDKRINTRALMDINPDKVLEQGQLLSPSTIELGNSIKDFMTGVKETVYKSREEGLAQLEKLGAFKGKNLNITGAYDNLIKNLDDVGMINTQRNVNSLLNQESITKTLKTKGQMETTSFVIDDTAKNSLITAHNLIDNLRNRDLDYKSIENVRKSVDKLIEEAGGWENAKISSNTTKILKNLRADLNNTLNNSVLNVKLPDGRNASEAMKILQKDYSLFRDAFDPLAHKIKDYDNIGDLVKVAEDISKMKNLNLVQSYENLSNISGLKNSALKNFQDLREISASRDLSRINTGNGFMSSILGNVIGYAPRQAVSREVFRNNVVNVVDKSITSAAKGIDFMNKLGVNHKQQLLTNDKYLMSFLSAMSPETFQPGGSIDTNIIQPSFNYVQDKFNGQ